MHAIWGADQIARLDDYKKDQVLTSLRGLLEANHPALRAAAAKVVGERADIDAVSGLRKLLSDDSARVRYFAAMSLGKLKDVESFSAVVALLKANENTDPAIRHAGVSYLASLGDPGKVAELKTDPDQSVRRAAVVALRRLRSGELTNFLNDASPLVTLGSSASDPRHACSRGDELLGCDD